MKNITVTVLKKDLEGAEGLTVHNCLVARAIKRQLHCVPSVGVTTVGFYDKRKHIYRDFWLNKKDANLIEDFVYGRPIRFPRKIVLRSH